jgi:predicted nucleic acid-binding protein
MPNAKTNYFVDTNILIYAVDPAEREKRSVAADLLRRMIGNRTLVLSAQSLNECYRVITDRRRMMPRADARRFVAAFVPFCSAPYSSEVTSLAWRIQDAVGFSWWDCVLVGSAVLAGCKVLLSEDMQHGHTLNGLTIMNPFDSETLKLPI